MLRRSAGLAVLSLCAALAGAQPQTYAQRGTQIRAGIALLDSAQTAGVPSNPTPFVWYNLDSNREVKPAGWNIYNPNAPGQATPEIVNRWTLLAGAVGGGAPAPLERINKRHAAYWEVRISQTSEVQMAQYDILYVNATGNVSLNTIERERLRQFVDRGGVLWVEVANIGGNFNADNTINNFPLPFGMGGAGAGFGRLDVFHPVLSYPYAFSASNLDYLNNGGVGPTLAQANPFGTSGALNPAVSGDWYKLKPVILQGGVPTMMVGRIGDGFAIISTRNTANYLNRIRTSGGYLPNNTYYAEKPEGGLDKGSDVIGKLAINVISLGSSSEQPGNGTRKSGSSPIDIGAPLLTRFNEPVANLDHGLKNQFPVAAYKGLAVVSTTSGIRVYDANPKSDLDGDGNPDDGVQDLSLGDPLDLVWTSNGLAGPISAPTCLEVAQPGGGIPVDQILVTQADGSVAAFNAFPTAGGQILPGPHAPVYTVAAPANVVSVDTSQISHGPYAPTYHEGLAYVASNPGSPTPTGQVWVFNPATGLGLDTGGQRWLVGDPFGPAIQQISGPPTVGYIPIADNSSGLDKVVYVPSRPGSSLAGPNAGIYSLWAGARGESPISATVVGPTLTVTTRASQRGLYVVNGGQPSLGIKLTVLRASGDPLTIPEMNLLFNGGVLQGSPGVLDFTLTGVWDPTYTVRVDYTVDWGRGPAASQSIVRGNIFLPDDPNNRRTIVGNIAMSNQGTIYVVHTTTVDTPGGGEGGAFYAFRERGQGAFRCVARYDAYRRHTINLNQAATVQVESTVSDNDPLVGLVAGGFLSGTANSLTFVTGPAVRGDYVYAGAVMRKTGGSFPFIGFIPFTTILAFKAEPETAEIQVGDLSDGFTLVQPDMIRSTNKSVPTQFNVAGQGQYQYLRESGKVRFDSLMTPNRGQISSCFSLSQPVILRSGGRPDRLVYPDANAGSRWSPLAWYTVLHGVGEPTTPVVTGGTLFMGGSSSLPYFITLMGPPVLPPPTTGVLFGINADIGERDSFNFPDPGRPWNRQAVVMKNNGGGNIDVNPNLRWPQSQGITSFQVWAERVLQASMPFTNRTMSIAAGEGAFFATGGETGGAYGGQGRIYGFSRADFVVCDEGRLGRYDPAGNPIFATDVSSNSGTDVNVGGASSVRAVQRPIRAYPVGASDLAVVDPATNRVVRLDGAGRELRSIEGFRLDSASTVTLEANEPYTLNNPRDVAVYTEYVANPANVTNPQPLEYWVHYVIADAGNRRVIDLIDRYEADPATRVVGDIVLVGSQRQLGMLRWHSPAEYSGKRFEYNAITRAYDAGSNTYYYIAGIGSATPTRIDTGLDTPAGTLPREAKDGNGGIVIFSPVNPTLNTIINEVRVPTIPAGSYIDPNTGTYSTTATPAREKKLSNLTSVTVRNVRNGAGTLWAIMFTDATGVYEVTQPVLNGPWVVRWMMPKEVYRYLRNVPGAPPNLTVFPNPLSLRANYARRLDSGEVLIVNGYVGKRSDGADFSGEVVQVDGDFDPGAGQPYGFAFNKRNFGFSFGSVRFELNLLTETRKLYQPVFADRR